MTLPPQTTLCNEAFNNLFAALKNLRNVDVLMGSIPANWLMRRQCTIAGNDLSARDVLAQIAKQIGASTGAGPAKPGEELRIVWGLLYDVPWQKYVLSMYWVRDKSTGARQPEIVKPVQQPSAFPPATDAPTRRGVWPAFGVPVKPADSSTKAVTSGK